MPGGRLLLAFSHSTFFSFFFLVQRVKGFLLLSMAVSIKYFLGSGAQLSSSLAVKVSVARLPRGMLFFLAFGSP